jgi:hypothetical protein
MDKAEIRKILSELSFQCHTCGSAEYDCPTTEEEKCDKFLFATSSLTALIIKWLEERKYDYYSESGAPVEMDNFEASAYAKGVIKGRNQLITELIGGVR